MKALLRCTGLYTLIVLSLSQAEACDLHAGGQFGQFHPLAQRHYPQADFQILSLSHTRKKSVRPGGSAFVDVRYHVPARYNAVSVKVVSSKGLNIESARALSLDNLNGNYRLKLTSLQPGTHVITLKIAGTLDGQAFTSEQNIDVVSG